MLCMAVAALDYGDDGVTAACVVDDGLGDHRPRRASVWSLYETTFRYPGATEPAVADLTLELEAGRMTALLGPNGSGKSTVLQLLLGTLAPTEGRVTFKGRPLRAWSRAALAREVGVVPQLEADPPFTVREMVGMGRYPHLGLWRRAGLHDRDAVERAMSQCDVSRFAPRWVSMLSGGERQRVRLARALAQEPSALILDEPTASLDVRHEMELFELLRELRQAGTTVVIATHNLDLAARFANVVVLLGRGSLVASGDADAVLTAAQLSTVYEWPMEVTRSARGGVHITPCDSQAASRPSAST
jgi:ABC-type cobalamin/Fe3+-siderophores transport system ATPase subunit